MKHYLVKHLSQTEKIIIYTIIKLHALSAVEVGLTCAMFSAADSRVAFMGGEGGINCLFGSEGMLESLVTGKLTGALSHRKRALDI